MSELRESIMRTSLELFEKHGFHGVTVNQIVAASNTSKGGFYHHFQSKDELLFVIHDTFITYVLKEAKAANEIHQSPINKIQAIVKAFVRVFDLYKPHISVFYQESIYLKPEYEKQMKRKRDAFKQMVFQVIKEGQESGDFRRELPMEIVGMAILGMVNWIYKWYQRDGKYSIDQIADVYVDFILHAILPSSSHQQQVFDSHLLERPFFY
ncbi:TetR/AcrR family transcriptional regulator [Thalassobacillus pellis]|uniref:TetR/AcrR family transcriptional regulator n=1 Tax=Thalassobacillus pellis TaxID=748008 RepID=UPI00195F6565|nr:TetR/AcrR family transcriptional regulator [Thalassobacillus pellis]MBM7552611.1 AcrR family transcriptional regulator [Thalassobacillus pellis]